MKKTFPPKVAGVDHEHNKTGDEHECPAKLPWEKMELSYRGNVAEMIQIGGGKLTKAGGDPGEPRKPRGIEHKFDESMSGPSSEPLTNPFSDPSGKL